MFGAREDAGPSTSCLAHATTQLLSNLPTLCVPDRARFTLYGTGPRLATPTATIPEVFSQRARDGPEHIAGVHLGRKITYGELDACADRLCAELLRRGISRGARVCLLVQRSLAMLVGILGVLKAGAAYIPLDGGIVTDQTLAYVLKDSGAALVLYTKKFEGRLCGDVQALCLDEYEGTRSRGRAPGSSGCRRKVAGSMLDEAYVIYTSGTTGMPKGVSVSHRNVTNLLCSAPGNLGIRPGTKVSQLLNIAFDMCVWEVLGCLLNGGTLVLRGSRKQDWEDVLSTVDVVIATPTLLQGYTPANYPNIRTVATAGEPCPQPLADAWSVGKTFYNCCGPTETTIVNTMHKHTNGTPLSIGTPTPNNAVYVLDEHLRPAPIGTVGTMWAAGLGVSRGYVNRLELTSQRYVPDPFSGSGVMFNTGDLGRWNERGELEHFGRLDDQVKIKGFRVELDGVSATLEAHPGVAKAVALLVDGTLCGFVAPTATVPHEATLKAFAGQRLPYYAVPARFVALERFPTTKNGKVDKCALRELAAGRQEMPAPVPARMRVGGAMTATCGVSQVTAEADTYASLGPILV